jgi:ankyrin repeat protein
LLLEKGVPITSVDNTQENILHKAVHAKDLEFVKMLLEWNSKNKGELNVNAKNNSNQTVLNIIIPNATKHYKSKAENAMEVDVIIPSLVPSFLILLKGI